MTYRVKNVIFLFFVLRYLRKTFDSLRGYGIIGSIKRVYATIKLWVFYLVLRAPGVRGQVDKQVTTALTKLEEKMVRKGPGITSYLTLPKEGWTSEKIRAELTQLAGMEHAKWEEGRVSGAVYHGGEDLSKLQTEAIGNFSVSNPLHPDVFPGVRKMEAEIVAMVCYLSNPILLPSANLILCRCSPFSMVPQMELVSQLVVAQNQS